MAQIVYRSNVKFFGGGHEMPKWAEDRLSGYADEAGVEALQVSSGYRSPEDQARIMAENVASHGLASQRSLYGANGNRILDLYPNQAAMAAKIREIGPEKVSRHMAEDAVTFDIAPSSMPGSGFEDLKARMKQAPQNANWRQDPDTIYEIGELYYPPKDPALHVEFPGNSSGVAGVGGTGISPVKLGVGVAVGVVGYKAITAIMARRKRR